MGNKIQLFGELESVAVDKKLVDAVQVKDSAWVDPEEMIHALVEERDPVATEETQSKINERLREEALYAQSQFNNLSIHYNTQTKKLQLLLEGESLNEDGIDVSDFTKDGMIETVLGPVTPVYDDLTDKGAASASIPTAIWVVAEDTGEQAFFAFDVDIPRGYLRIQEITLGKTYLGFIWNTNTDADKTEGKVYDSKNFKASALDVSKLAEVYTAGGGLELRDNKFSVKLGGQSEGYLKIDGDDYLVIQGVDKKITDTVEDAKTDLQSSIDSVEKDYKEADAALLGTTDDPTDADTIHGVRNYATDVARLSGGYYLSKLVIGGNSVALYANPDINETTNVSDLVIDLASIFVSVGAPRQTEVEVQVQKGADDTVTLSWSGLTLSGDNPLIVRYRVLRK